jgi:hypothetical protein
MLLKMAGPRPGHFRFGGLYKIAIPGRPFIRGFSHTGILRRAVIRSPDRGNTMLGRLFLLAACLTAPVLAAPSEPSPAQIRHLAQACTAEDAFGLHFAQKMSSSASLPAGPEWAPVQLLSIRLAPDSGQVLEVEATASFAKALMSNEDRAALATWVFRALDSEIQSGHDFAHREMRPNGTTYHSADGLTLDLSHDGVVVHLACAKT